MRKNRKGLVSGLACGFGVVGASAIAFSAAASSFVGRNVISEDTSASGLNYTSSGDNEASLMVLGGDSDISSSMIVASGADSVGVALQGDANFSISDSTVINSGLNGAAFLLDGSTGSLTVSNTSASSTGGLAVAQGSQAALTLSANESANGSILVDSDSVLSLSMTDGNKFIGDINPYNQGLVNLSVSADSVLYLTGDSYLGSLNDEASNLMNIYLCGYTLTVNGEAIAANDSDCSVLIGGYGQPTIIPDDYDPNPSPAPAPEPDPTPPAPEPTPDPVPDPTPDPAPAPEPEPVHYEPQVVIPNTGDTVQSQLFAAGSTLMGLSLCFLIATRNFTKGLGR